jgi:hypothetical protein
MALGNECPKCGALSISFVQGVCRACYMRDRHQRRSAVAITQCPRCGVASANFVQGVCRACYMRNYHQRRSAVAAGDHQMVFESPTLDDSEDRRFCVECKAPRIYAHGLCYNCYMRGYMRDRQRRQRSLCIECKTPSIYARGLCRDCYVLDHRQRQRFCVECGASGLYARGLCQNCYMRDLRRDHRIKRRVCAVCAVSFQSVRRDALYCSPSCRQKAHRVGKTQLFPKVAPVDERRTVQSVIDAQVPTLAPRIEVQAHAVADINRRLGQIDSPIEEAAKRDRTDGALSRINGQHQAGQVLARGRWDASTLPDIKTEHTTLRGKERLIEPEAAPIRRVAKPIGADTGGEWAIRWLLALMMLCCDPPAGRPEEGSGT